MKFLLKKYLFVFIILILFITIAFIFRMPAISFRNNTLIIKGSNPLSKRINDIVVIDTVNQVPLIRNTEKGISAWHILKGNFLTEQGEKVKMYVFKNKPPFIYIEYRRANKLYLNFRDPEKTKKFYRQLKVKKAKGYLP